MGGLSERIPIAAEPGSGRSPRRERPARDPRPRALALDLRRGARRRDGLRVPRSHRGARPRADAQRLRRHDLARAEDAACLCVRSGGDADPARRDAGLASMRTRLLGVIASEADRLARIVNDVLCASRLDSRQLASRSSAATRARPEPDDRRGASAPPPRRRDRRPTGVRSRRGRRRRGEAAPDSREPDRQRGQVLTRGRDNSCRVRARGRQAPLLGRRPGHRHSSGGAASGSSRSSTASTRTCSEAWVEPASACTSPASSPRACAGRSGWTRCSARARPSTSSFPSPTASRPGPGRPRGRPGGVLVDQ